MYIQRLDSLSPLLEQARVLWEKNMREPWADYAAADMFVVRDDDVGGVLGGFAVYWDESDDVKGHFCSGWAGHRCGVPTAAILRQLVSIIGDTYFKTDKRTAKILLEKIAKPVKKTNEFVYYIMKR